MDLPSLHRDLELLHAQGDSGAILKRVEGALPELGTLPPSPLIGAIFRYAMLARYRQEEYGLGDEWWERAMDQFAACKYLKGVAMLLITPSFKSLALVRYHPAMQTVALMVVRSIVAIGQAVAPEAGYEDEVYSTDTILRQAHEKHAYCLFRIGKHDTAIESYRKALDHVASESPEQSEGQLRAELKVRGGAALARYCLGDPESHRRAKEELQEIERRSQQGAYLEDVHRITVENLALIQEGCTDPNKFRHYELP